MTSDGIEAIPYWRLSAFYLFYFSALGAFLPFWSLYLQTQGYDHAEIGVIMAIFPATKIISPNLWGWLADRTDRSVLFIRLSSWLTVASFALIFVAQSFSSMVVASILVGLFWNAPLPLFEAVTLAHLRSRPHHYSLVRMWGSLGFIVAVTVLGQSLDRWLLVDCLPQVIFVTFVFMSMAPLCLKERSVRGNGLSLGTFWSILLKPQVVAFFTVFLLVQMAHGPYYTFFSIYLKDNGYSASQTGFLWALGVVAEIVLFLVMDRALRRYCLRRLLLVGLFLGVLRWGVIAWSVNSFWMIAGAQLLHAATFGVSHVAAIQLVHQHFYGLHQGKGQALYSSISYGFGGMVGNYLSGQGWDVLGPEPIFLAASIINLIAFIIAWIWVDRPVHHANGRALG